MNFFQSIQKIWVPSAISHYFIEKQATTVYSTSLRTITCSQYKQNKEFISYHSIIFKELEQNLVIIQKEKKKIYIIFL